MFNIQFIDSTAGILTSTSSGGSSASSTLPKSLTEGDLETSYLLKYTVWSSSRDIF